MIIFKGKFVKHFKQKSGCIFPASASVTEEEYRRRYNDLTDRFRAEEEKHKQLTARRKRMEAESVSIGGMLTELEELEAPPIEFDEKLWHAVVDRVTYTTMTAWCIP